VTGTTGATGQGELALELPRRLLVATPARLTSWLECPRRYRFTYVDRPSPPKGPPWAHTSVGASVHLALAAFWRLDRLSRTAVAAGRLVERVWLRDGFRDETQSTRWRVRARTMVERYAGQLDPLAEPVGVERTVATRTPVLALSGRVDRLDDRVAEDGSRQLVVVDYKTGRHLPTTYDVRSSLPLALYALAVSRMFRRPCHRVELHHLPSEEVVAHDHTAESLGRHLGRAEAVAQEAAAATTFPAKPSPSCRWCDFLRVCPEGSAQYRPAQPWDALAEHGAG
jgi:putative RecB family exonuclease